MNVKIVDAAALRAITPAALAAYARGEGWIRTGTYGKFADVYTAAERPELLIPRTDRVADYAGVVSELIGILAASCGRDQFALYRDLIGADRDLVRVRARGADDDGSLSIDAGVGLVSYARELLLAAACAASNPQSLYRAGANKEASDYMNRVRLGQTEQGSFVVTLLAPVPPLLQAPLDAAWTDFEDEPYDRKVTRRLMDGLEACRSAAELASAGNGMVEFERGVDRGVSANLCEAVAKLVEYSAGLEVGVTWARTRPGPQVHRKVSFSTSDAEILKEAARTFRAHRSRQDVELFGTVYKLQRDQAQLAGQVTLKALVDKRIQSVKAMLDQASYSLAVQAHDRKLPVVVRGDLERVGQRWQLSGAELLNVGTEDENEDDAVGEVT